MAQMNSTIDVHEATAHFSQLLERVEAGEEVTITRHGSPIAKLIPVRRESTPEQRRAAFEAMKKLAATQTLGGLKIKDLINEGRP